MKALSLIFASVLYLFSSTESSGQGWWTELNSFPPGGRERTFYFTIGDKIYVGSGRGLNALTDVSQNENDVWAYDFKTGEWTEKNPFPGGKIRNAAGFSIGEQGYIVTGHNGETFQKIFWRYDPVADHWEKLQDFPGPARSHVVAFSIGGNGYVGLGGTQSVYFEDFYKYDPQTEEWSEVSSFPGLARWRAFAFVLDGKAYVGGGSHYGESTKDYTDCWMYDPQTDGWSYVSNFPNDLVIGCFAFSLGGKGYVGEGAEDLYLANYGTKIWEFDPQSKGWSIATEMIGPRTGRIFSFCTTHEGKAYIGGGSSYLLNLYFYDDFYSWDKNGMTGLAEFENWEALGAGQPDPNQTIIYDLAASHEDTLWAIPLSNTLNYNPLEITYSADGGNHWENALVDTDPTYFTAKFSMLSGQKGFLAGSKEFNGTGKTKVFYTANGGQKWVEKLGSAENVIYEAGGIHFFDQNVGLCWGNNVTDQYRMVIYRTIDGGNTWALLSDPALPIPLSNLFSYTPSGTNGFDAIGDTIWIPVDTRILKSTDRGESWTSTSIGVFHHLIYSLAFESASKGIFLTDNYPYEWATRAYLTQDGGESWSEIPVPDVPSAVSIEHIPGSGGGYIAHSTWTPSPKIIYTPDSGVHWYNIEAPPSMASLRFIAPGTGFGGGQLLPGFKSGVYKWKGNLDAVTPITEPGKGITDEDFSVFPQPVSTALSLYNKANHFIKDITIADLIGRNLKKMDVLKNDKVIRIPLDGIRPGIYLLCIQTEDSGQHVIRFLKF